MRQIPEKPDILNRKHSDSFIAECRAALSALQGEYKRLLNEKINIEHKLESIGKKATRYSDILRDEGIDYHDLGTDNKKMTNADRAVEVLKAHEGPMHARNIWHELQSHGARTQSLDPVNMLAATLAGDPRFTRTGPRTFDLTERDKRGTGLFAQEK